MATMTAEQQREQARREHEAWLAACATSEVVSFVGNKWFGQVVNVLADGPHRYSQLERRIASVSPKMLTQTLRTMERDGIVDRQVTPTVPVRVDYSLTPLGRTLLPILLELKTWAEAHVDDIAGARAAYDARD